MDVFEQIKKEHKKIKKLLKQTEAVFNEFPEITESIIFQLKDAIHKNIVLEDKVFYSFLQNLYEKHGFLKEPLNEHKRIQEYIDELVLMPVFSQDWENKLERLKKTVLEHIDKEETEVFSIVRCILSKAQVDNLSSLMKMEKLSLVKNEPKVLNTIFWENTTYQNFHQAS